ncbi:uncharacterized protein A4U43_C07F20730 [Asparagus officinalis]|uniref:Uncharacterized protein n=1 Tax=Asparagus officinalis TaxID=4686 RepID=A0A5P1EDJ6_ASPOF|nr:uncharacterized protein A4U43_C07F20730 [Asparagus officinalis]
MTSKPMEELTPSSASPSPSPPPLSLEDDRARLQSPSANQDEKAKEEEEAEDTEEACRTPTSNESKLSSVPLTCPPAPKKARSYNSGCRRRLSEFDFLEVSSEELEKLFSRRSGSKKRKWSSF